MGGAPAGGAWERTPRKADRSLLSQALAALADFSRSAGLGPGLSAVAISDLKERKPCCSFWVMDH